MPGTLHLHHHLRAIGQTSSVHLGERGGGHRFVGEPGEDVAHLHVQLVLDHGADLGHRDRFDLVLEPSEGFEVVGGQEIGTGGQHLAELDEGRSHRLEVAGESAGVVVMARAGGLGRREVLEFGLEAHLIDEVAPRVPEQEASARRRGATVADRDGRRGCSQREALPGAAVLSPKRAEHDLDNEYPG